MIKESGKKSKLPVYLFYGDEDFLIDEKIGELKNRLGSSAFNTENLEGDDVTDEQLCSALQGGSLLGGGKLVIISGLKISADNQDSYLALLNDLAPGVTVVLRAAVDQRSKFYRFIAERGEVIECRSFAPWEQDRLVDWIKARVREGGKTISDSAARLFEEISGNNLRLLSSDIGKMITYVGGRNEITADDVLALASPGEKSVFDLLEALRRKNAKEALALFQTLMKNRADLFQLLGTLASQYRIMLQLKALPAGAAGNPRQAAGAIRANPYFVGKCQENVGKFQPAELRSALEQILMTGLKLKTGAAQLVTFELLLSSLCGE